MILYIISFYPPCILAFFNAFCDSFIPSIKSIMNHINPIDVFNSAFLILIVPEYILNGKSHMYLNGNTYAIAFNVFGKNASGTSPPSNISPTTIRNVNIPFSSRVKNTIRWNNIVIDVTKRLDMINDIKNIMNVNKFGGSVILYG